MIILLSPTKKQKRHPQTSEHALLFEKEKQQILDHLQTLNPIQIKQAYKISDALTHQTHEQLLNYQEDSPAIYTYQGEAFKSLDPQTLTKDDLNYAQEHLYIFSALYGLLKPFHAISLYRLDLLTKLELNLIKIWRPIITRYFNTLNQPLVNLASQEFFNLINLDTLQVPIYHVQFLNKDHKVISAQAKKARGAYARALLQSKHFNLKEIEIEDYHFSHQLDNTYIFIKNTID